MGIGGFPSSHRLSLDVLGMHGAQYAIIAINEADLVIALGVRFDDRVTGKVSDFICHGRIIHTDIDRTELNKNKTVTLPICADVKTGLSQLLAADPDIRSVWQKYCAALKRDFPYPIREETGISPQKAISLLSEMTNGEAIVSLGGY
jgi:acetolactate synthase-1/2/3 large subunit|tara:strand:- start:696 stop:1136 length:441 start_codon:yes stop_codon:yes gene_type:complete